MTSRYATLGLGGGLHFPKVGGKRVRALGNTNVQGTTSGTTSTNNGPVQSSQYFSTYYRQVRDDNKENVYRIGGNSNVNGGVSKVETALPSSHYLSGQTIPKEITHHIGGYPKDPESSFKESTRNNRTQALEGGFGPQQPQGSPGSSSRFQKKYSKDPVIDSATVASVAVISGAGAGGTAATNSGASKEKAEKENGSNGERSGTRSKSIKSASTHHSNGKPPRPDPAAASTSSHGQRSETPDSTTKQPLSKKSMLCDANGNVLPLSGRSTLVSASFVRLFARIRYSALYRCTRIIITTSLISPVISSL